MNDAIRDVSDAMTIAVGGFGGAGFPEELVRALEDQGRKDLVIISNNAARFERLINSGAVSQIICSFPFGGASATLRESIANAGVELKLLPQGTLSECLRAAGSGLGGVLTRVGFGTSFAEGRSIINVDGTDFILEPPLSADFAFVHAELADRWGNLSMRGTARNFNLVMAMAAATTIAEANQVVEVGHISPDGCDVPGIFVDAVVQCSNLRDARDIRFGLDT
ncbi:MAG: 3-oxoacid CoA-transferase subunit A [Actinomycetota bacterium]|nr:MAG: 3-oxoacid CoA-transferase subunit A [Actinomycetota bacterium]